MLTIKYLYALQRGLGRRFLGQSSPYPEERCSGCEWQVII